jgi:protein-disulfide isomerase
MANKRVESGRRRNAGVVKSARKPTANRAFFVIIAAIAIVGIAALTYAASRPKNGTAIGFDSTLPKVESQGYVVGSPNAKLEVTEFGDYECPQCGRFATLTEADVRSRLVNSGEIRYRYIDFPLEMHRNTWNASIAAACADKQGKFWEMHDAIFESQDQWDGEATTNPNKVLKQVAARIPGINTDSFNVCLETRQTQPRVQAHYQLALARKIQATPTFFIGSQKFEGFLPYDEFKKRVGDAIKQLGPTAPGAGGDSARSAPLKKSGT